MLNKPKLSTAINTQTQNCKSKGAVWFEGEKDVTFNDWILKACKWRSTETVGEASIQEMQQLSDTQFWYQNVMILWLLILSIFMIVNVLIILMITAQYLG